MHLDSRGADKYTKPPVMPAKAGIHKNGAMANHPNFSRRYVFMSLKEGATQGEIQAMKKNWINIKEGLIITA